MERSPLVSVIMPVFNCEKYVAASIQSILSQTYAEFELIIIDDGSTDGTRSCIDSFSDDKRIRLYSQGSNKGIAESVNWGIAVASGEYIARMDADDIAKGDRLELQVGFMESNRDFGLCSTNAISIDETGTEISGPWWHPKRNAIKWDMIWGNPIAHPTVMVRRRYFGEGGFTYDKEYEPAEDYHLWCRLALKTRFHRLPQVLLNYRMLKNSTFRTSKQKALLASIRANETMVQELVDTEIPEFHGYLTDFNLVLPKRDWNESVWEIHRWFEKIKRSLLVAKQVEDSELRQITIDEKSRIHSVMQNDPAFSHGLQNRFFALRERADGIRKRLFGLRE